MLYRFLIGLIAGGAIFFSAQANATSLTARNPAGIVAALQANGFQAKLDSDDSGNPQIITGTGGSKIMIAFSGCEAGINCDYIEFLSVWTCTSQQMQKCNSILDSWVKEEHMAGLLKTPDGIAMYYYMIVGDGSFSDEVLVATLQYFSKEAIEWQGNL
jgi:hypothetical protein